MRRFAAIVLFALASSARAEEAPAIPPAEQSSLEGFAAAHPDCREWDDGCATCRREAQTHCSTPGIACQPHEIACKTP